MLGKDRRTRSCCTAPTRLWGRKCSEPNSLTICSWFPMVPSCPSTLVRHELCYASFLHLVSCLETLVPHGPSGLRCLRQADLLRPWQLVRFFRATAKVQPLCSARLVPRALGAPCIQKRFRFLSSRFVSLLSLVLCHAKTPRASACRGWSETGRLSPYPFLSANSNCGGLSHVTTEQRRFSLTRHG